MSGNVSLWLAWALFGVVLAGLLWKRYLPALREVAPEVVGPEPLPAAPGRAPRAWLVCEEGAAVDRRVRWFELRRGGRTVIGGRPRAATEAAAYLYLTAEDLREEHAVIRYAPERGRYVVSPCGDAPVLHNNEPLVSGEMAELADGDTLDLGRISRFRFTLTGPETG